MDGRGNGPSILSKLNKSADYPPGPFRWESTRRGNLTLEEECLEWIETLKRNSKRI